VPYNLTTWDLPALLPIREEGVLRIFIALKNPSLWPGSNPQPLGSMESTLTTTPPRRLSSVVRTIAGMTMYLLAHAGTVQNYITVQEF
jgi:hypothetical protein